MAFFALGAGPPSYSQTVSGSRGGKPARGGSGRSRGRGRGRGRDQRGSSFQSRSKRESSGGQKPPVSMESQGTPSWATSSKGPADGSVGGFKRAQGREQGSARNRASNSRVDKRTKGGQDSRKTTRAWTMDGGGGESQAGGSDWASGGAGTFGGSDGSNGVGMGDEEMAVAWAGSSEREDPSPKQARAGRGRGQAHGGKGDGIPQAPSPGTLLAEVSEYLRKCLIYVRGLPQGCEDAEAALCVRQAVGGAGGEAAAIAVVDTYRDTCTALVRPAKAAAAAVRASRKGGSLKVGAAAGAETVYEARGRGKPIVARRQRCRTEGASLVVRKGNVDRLQGKRLGVAAAVAGSWLGLATGSGPRAVQAVVGEVEGGDRGGERATQGAQISIDAGQANGGDEEENAGGGGWAGLTADPEGEADDGEGNEGIWADDGFAQSGGEDEDAGAGDGLGGDWVQDAGPSAPGDDGEGGAGGAGAASGDSAIDYAALGIPAEYAGMMMQAVSAQQKEGFGGGAEGAPPTSIQGRPPSAKEPARSEMSTRRAVQQPVQASPLATARAAAGAGAAKEEAQKMQRRQTGGMRRQVEARDWTGDDDVEDGRVLWGSPEALQVAEGLWGKGLCGRLYASDTRHNRHKRDRFKQLVQFEIPHDGVPLPLLPLPPHGSSPPTGPGIRLSAHSRAGDPPGWFNGRPSLKALAVVRHTRSASGTADEDMHEEDAVRPPSVLLRVCDYLFGCVLDADKHGSDPRFEGRPPTLLEIHEFVFNRTRAVRKHLSTQGFKYRQRNDCIAMEILERCARYHVMMMHELADCKDFQAGLNMEQLSASLKAAIALYDDAEERHRASVRAAALEGRPAPSPLRSPHEGEIRGLWLMLHAQDTRETVAVATFLKQLPPRLRSNSRVLNAVWLYKCTDANDSAALLRGLREGRCEGRPLSYLERCLSFHALRAQRMRLLRSVAWSFVAAKGGQEGAGGKASVSLVQMGEWMGLSKEARSKDRVRYLAEYHGVRLVRRGRGHVLWPEGKKSAQDFLPDGDGTPFVAARGASLVRPPRGVGPSEYGNAPLKQGGYGAVLAKVADSETADPNARARVVIGSTWAVRSLYRMPSYGVDEADGTIVVTGAQRARLMEGREGGGLAKGSQVWCGGMPAGFLWVESSNAGIDMEDRTGFEPHESLSPPTSFGNYSTEISATESGDLAHAAALPEEEDEDTAPRIDVGLGPSASSSDATAMAAAAVVAAADLFRPGQSSTLDGDFQRFSTPLGGQASEDLRAIDARAARSSQLPVPQSPSLSQPVAPSTSESVDPQQHQDQAPAAPTGEVSGSGTAMGSNDAAVQRGEAGSASPTDASWPYAGGDDKSGKATSVGIDSFGEQGHGTSGGGSSQVADVWPSQEGADSARKTVIGDDSAERDLPVQEIPGAASLYPNSTGANQEDLKPQSPLALPSVDSQLGGPAAPGEGAVDAGSRSRTQTPQIGAKRAYSGLALLQRHRAGAHHVRKPSASNSGAATERMSTWKRHVRSARYHQDIMIASGRSRSKFGEADSGANAVAQHGAEAAAIGTLSVLQLHKQRSAFQLLVAACHRSRRMRTAALGPGTASNIDRVRVSVVVRNGAFGPSLQAEPPLASIGLATRQPVQCEAPDYRSDPDERPRSFKRARVDTPPSKIVASIAKSGRFRSPLQGDQRNQTPRQTSLFERTRDLSEGPFGRAPSWQRQPSAEKLQRHAPESLRVSRMQQGLGQAVEGSEAPDSIDKQWHISSEESEEEMADGSDETASVSSDGLYEQLESILMDI